MLNDMLGMLRQYGMVQPGETLTCAVSGGADSMALLWAMYLLREKLDIRLQAAHFNHQLRGAESDGDEAFVREFCDRYEIPFLVGSEAVRPCGKGLEAAAREARYRFFSQIPGKIATAHTADDNAETVLLHLVRGTGLKGLGAIAPVRDRIIRPMLGVTRAQVEIFLQEYHIPHREDSSNAGDDFLRNRLRHRVMPLLSAENPRLVENLSAMALRLRADEDALQTLSQPADETDIRQLRTLHPAQRSRVLERMLKCWGVREPEAEHIALAEKLVFSDKPSAEAHFPGNVTVFRNYDRLESGNPPAALEAVVLPCPGYVELPELQLRVVCVQAEEIINSREVFTVQPVGELILRHREPGDCIRLGGTKSLKKLFIDAKIPASQRLLIPILADEAGIVGVCGFGADENRRAKSLPAIQVRFENINTSKS